MIIKPKENDLELIYKIATIEQVTLSQEHLIIINLLQNFYKEFTLVPSTRALINYVKANAKDLELDSIKFAKLFPKGIAQACKIANLPDSPRCL